MFMILRGILIPFIGTALGAGCVYLMKGELNRSVQRGLTGFAGGVMVAASIWSLLIPAMNYSEHMGKFAFVPAAVGFWAGILFLLLKIQLPEVLMSPVLQLKSVATPLALVVLGASLHLEQVKGNKRNLIIVVLGRLLLVPAAVLLPAAALGFRGIELITLLGIFASPTGVSSFTMAQQMGGDGELAGEAVVFTSLFSLFSMFFWTFLLKQLGMF